MAETSGSLGGDDSSKLDELMKSIQGNSGKLEILNKILSKIEDAGGSTAKSDKSFLKNIETVLDKSIVDKFANKALAKQADLDRLASNTFRATETVVSEVLSRIGGTSFYPVLSAFRVARESVAVATGKPQNELDVMDMFKFVNDATKELFDSIFGSITGKTKELTPAVDSLSQSIDNTIEHIERLNEAYREQVISAESETKPLATSLTSLLESLEKGSKSIDDLSIDQIKDLFAFIKTSSNANLGGGFDNILSNLSKALAEVGESVSDKDIDQLSQKLKLEKQLFLERKRALFEEAEANKTLVGGINEVSEEAVKAAKLAAGIAGSSVTIGFLTENVKNLVSSLGDLSRTSVNSLVSSVTSAKGLTGITSLLSPVVQSGTNTLTKATATAGNILGSNTAVVAGIGSAIGGSLGATIANLGPVVAGPIGGIIGKVIGDTVGLGLNTAIGILESIERGVSEIVDDVVPFSPTLLDSVISRNFAILSDDIRRGNEIGDELSRITEAQTKLQLASRQAFDSLLTITEPVLVSILTAASNMLTEISVVSKFIAELPVMKEALLAIKFFLDFVFPQFMQQNQIPPEFLDQQLITRPELLAKQNPGANVRLAP